MQLSTHVHHYPYKPPPLIILIKYIIKIHRAGIVFYCITTSHIP